MKKLIIGVFILILIGITLGILRDYFLITPQHIWSYILGEEQKTVSYENTYGYGYGTTQEDRTITDQNQKTAEEERVKNNTLWPQYANDTISSGEEETRKESENIKLSGDGEIKIEDENLYENCDLSKIFPKQKGEKYDVPCDDTIHLSAEYVGKNNEDHFMINIYDGNTLIIKELPLSSNEIDETTPEGIGYSRDLGLAYWNDPAKQGEYGENFLVYSTKTLSYRMFIESYGSAVSFFNDHQNIGFKLFKEDFFTNIKTAKGIECKEVDREEDYPTTKCKYTYTTFALPYSTRSKTSADSYEKFMNEHTRNYQKDVQIYTLSGSKSIVCYDSDAGGPCNYWIDISYNISKSTITRKDPYKTVTFDANDFTNIIQE